MQDPDARRSESGGTGACAGNTNQEKDSDETRGVDEAPLLKKKGTGFENDRGETQINSVRLVAICKLLGRPTSPLILSTGASGTSGAVGVVPTIMCSYHDHSRARPRDVVARHLSCRVRVFSWHRKDSIAFVLHIDDCSDHRQKRRSPRSRGGAQEQWFTVASCRTVACVPADGSAMPV